MLQTVSRDQIERLLADPVFRKNIDGLVQIRRQTMEAPAWLQQTYPQSPLNCVTYFSMEFMFAQSQAIPEMIELIRKLKAKYGLKIAVVSNEVRELNTYRLRKFKLNSFVDFFVSSCFVHLRKPDADIFRLARDLTQVPTEQILYIENTLMFARAAMKRRECGVTVFTDCRMNFSWENWPG